MKNKLEIKEVLNQEKVMEMVENFINKLLKETLKYTVLESEKINDEGYRIKIKIPKLNQRRKINKLLKSQQISLTFDDDNDEYEIILMTLLELDSNTKVEEYDTSERIWTLQKKVYGDTLEKGDTSFLKLYKNKIEISGDVDFNFNYSKYKYFLNIIKSTSEDSATYTRLKGMLEKCYEFHHTPENVSLIPKTGKLNNTKQRIGNDRFDTFIWGLSKFYNDEKALILNDGSCEYDNRKILNCFLDEFNDIKTYCKKIYHISDEHLLGDLIDNGDKDIDSCAGVYKYMELAVRYWIEKAEYFCTSNNKSVKSNYLNIGGMSPGMIYCIFSPYFQEEKA